MSSGDSLCNWKKENGQEKDPLLQKTCKNPDRVGTGGPPKDGFRNYGAATSPTFATLFFAKGGQFFASL